MLNIEEMITTVFSQTTSQQQRLLLMVTIKMFNKLVINRCLGCFVVFLFKMPKKSLKKVGKRLCLSTEGQIIIAQHST